MNRAHDVSDGPDRRAGIHELVDRLLATARPRFGSSAHGVRPTGSNPTLTREHGGDRSVQKNRILLVSQQLDFAIRLTCAVALAAFGDMSFALCGQATLRSGYTS